ncbi:hypothetical protein GCM10011507_02740 [Edaphobacter acidisoli]|uniref:Cytochrome c domain-containing protein n=1 Tax=Edaphobacter acidisoli TaxID=2040573 RepID=A0A916RFT8_9BACT|nr:c-type cytochrome [Edaphobacter acidisoli]GGA54932.1 hypothetical protein GCM10011507_02740 [Edaphobacter acidisoli]
MDKEDAKRGNDKYQQSCAICHGTDARGGSGSSLIDSSLVRHDVDGNLIGPVIMEGRTSKGMPAYPTFTQGQISDIAAFLHARIEVTNSVESSGPVGGYQLKKLLTGNVEAGKRYFNGEGGCARCHSPQKDLAGIASKYSPVELESRFLYPPVDLRTATITLPSNKTITGRLVHLDAFYVAIIAGTGWYRSWPLNTVKVEVKDPLDGHMELLHKYTNKDIHDVFSYLETLK